MKRIDYTHAGGFPLEQPVLDRMQSAYYDALRAFAGYLELADIGKYVISGCKIVGPDITPGMLYIDGDLCTFAGAVGTGATKIKKVTVTETAAFENGSNIAVFSDTIAQVDAAGTALSAFTRFYPVSDENYNNFSDAEKALLATVGMNAQQNVQSDWNETDNTADEFIKNKPQIPRILKQLPFFIGDFGTPSFPHDEQFLITFPDVGTSNYQVLATLMSNGAWALDTFVSFTIKDKTSSSFKINLKEPDASPAVQNLLLEYTLIEII